MIRTKVKKLILSIFIIILVMMLALSAAAYFYIDSKFDRINVEERRDIISAVMDDISGSKENDVLNIMLIGVDNDYLPGMADRGNADGQILLSINKRTKEIIMTSIMRDISISVPEQYNTKVTMVYHDFGTDTLLNTLETNFEIEIDNYVLVNYFNVIDIVDAIGGLELDLTAAEIQGMQIKIDNLNALTGEPYGTDMLSMEDAGINHLNGKQVAALLRIRNTGNDQLRTAKAREILTAMKDKALTLSVSEFDHLTDVIMENITTDMDSADMIALMLKAPGYIGYEFISNRIPVEGTYWGDGSYIYIDYPANIELLHSTIYGE